MFRTSAGLLILVALATAWLEGTLLYLLAALLCVVAPTLVMVWNLRGDPDVEAIRNATARYAYVFAVGLIPLFLMS